MGYAEVRITGPPREQRPRATRFFARTIQTGGHALPAPPTPRSGDGDARVPDAKLDCSNDARRRDEATWVQLLGIENPLWINRHRSTVVGRGGRDRFRPAGGARQRAPASSLERDETAARLSRANRIFLPSRRKRELLLNNAAGPAKQERMPGRLVRNVAGQRRLGHARCSGFVIGEDGTHTQVQEL